MILFHREKSPDVAIHLLKQYLFVYHHRREMNQNVISLAPLLLKLDYLAISITIQLVCTACTQPRGRITTIHNSANSANNCAKEMKFGSINGGNNGEHASADLLKISRTFRGAG